MLTKLRLFNFQAHKKLDIDLDGITVLVGPSDAGKSAVIRALRWLATNRPSGSEFVREGSDQCRVGLELDAKRIVRSKGKENAYSIDSQEYKAIGSKVPEDVSELLNLDPDLNFQNQHDAAFWFSLSAGEVAKRLNSIVDLDAIDDALSYSATLLKSARAEKDVLERQWIEDKESFDQLKFVPDIEREFFKLDKIEQDLIDKQDQTLILQAAVQKLQIHRKRAETLQDASEQFGDCQQAKDRLDALEGKCGALEERLERLSVFRQKTAVKIPRFSGLEQEQEKIEKIRSLMARLERSLSKVGMERSRLQELLSAEQVELDVLEQLEDEPERCPTCGQVINED